MNALVLASLVLPLSDQIELNWYFGPGACRFARSTCGPMLDHLRMFSLKAKPCPNEDCTDGILWGMNCHVETWEDKTGERHRSVYWTDPKDKSGKHYLTNECRTCKGTGHLEIRPARRTPTRSGYKVCYKCKGFGEDEYGETCYRCGGAGYVTSTPAFESGAEAHSVGAVVDDSTMQRAARISRRIARLEERLPGGSVIIQAMHCDEGLRWAAQGRAIMALYPLTEAGRKLCRGRQPRVALEASLTSTVPGIMALMAQALAEATRMHKELVDAWNATK